MNHNLTPTDRAAVVGVLNPLSQSAGARSTGWVSLVDFASVMAILQVGVLGSSATVDAKIEQATSAAGAGAKDVTNKAISQLTQAGTDADKQAIINVAQRDVDIANGFTHVRLTVTVATAACLTSAVLLGMDPRYLSASDNDAATVDEIV